MRISLIVVVSGVGLAIWISRVGMLSWWDSSMRSCSELVRSWGVLW